MTHSFRSSFASRRSKLLAAVASATAIALFALLLPAAATAGTTASTSALQDGGVLRLRLGAQDNLKFQPPDGSGGYAAATKTQSVANGQGCKIALSGDQLVTFQPPSGNGPSPYTGFVSDGIGVGSNGEGNGQPCGRIDPGQTLTLNLGTGLSGKVIDYAEIDLELKFGATVSVTGYLVQGTTATQVGSPVPYSSTGSDSGPDSADGDNYRIRYPRTGTTTVNRLVFNIVGSTGGASLEGGADGTGPCDASDGCTEPSLGQSIDAPATTTDSLFHLIDADGILNCGQTANSTPVSGTPTSSLERLQNEGNATCTPIPYNLDSSVSPTNQFVLFQKELGEQVAQFYWTVTWAPETGSYMETETQFDFGFGYQTLQLCLADGPDADPYPDLPPKAAGSPAGSPDPDPWCVVTTSTVLDPVTGLVTVTEKYFGKNDPGGKR